MKLNLGVFNPHQKDPPKKYIYIYIHICIYLNLCARLSIFYKEASKPGARASASYTGL